MMREKRKEAFVVRLDADVASRIRRDAARLKLSYGGWIRRIIETHYVRTDYEQIERQHLRLE